MQTKADLKQEWPFDAPNGWDRDIVRLLAWIQKYPHMWLFCSRAKYLELRVDTRDCGFNLYDRDKKPISPDEIMRAIDTLKHEFKDDGTMASLEYRQGARKEEPLLDEMNRMRAALQALVDDDATPPWVQTLAKGALPESATDGQTSRD